MKLSPENEIEKVASAVWGTPEGTTPYTSVPASWSVDGCQALPAATRRTSRQPVPTASHMGPETGGEEGDGGDSGGGGADGGDGGDRGDGGWGGGGGDGGDGGSDGGEGGSDGGWGGGGGDDGDGGSDGGKGGARWLMVTFVFVHAELHHARHVARPCGGEDGSSEIWYAQRLHFPSPSRSLAAVMLGALLPRSQPVIPLLASSL